jgi:hypothetical protein
LGIRPAAGRPRRARRAVVTATRDTELNTWPMLNCSRYTDTTRTRC